MTLYARARGYARRLGLGRVRDRIWEPIHAASWWVAVPPRRLKDLAPAAPLIGDQVALTYDDGPNPAVTPRLLEVLKKHDASATFFMCGRAAARHPELVKAVAEAGHAIGSHTWDHPRKGITALTDDVWQNQFVRTHRILEELVGSPVPWYRPPRGITNRPTWSSLREKGLTTVTWSIDGWDCKLRDPREIARGVLEQIEPGAIILLHDANAVFFARDEAIGYGDEGNQETTVEATELILTEIKQRGWNSVSIQDIPWRPMEKSGKPRRLTSAVRG